MSELHGKPPSSSPPDEEKLEELCPYCRRKIVIDPKICTVMHARPTCAKFDEMDAYEFLKEVRRQVQHEVLSGQLGPLRVIKGGTS